MSFISLILLSVILVTYCVFYLLKEVWKTWRWCNWSLIHHLCKIHLWGKFFILIYTFLSFISVLCFTYCVGNLDSAVRSYCRGSNWMLIHNLLKKLIEVSFTFTCFGLLHTVKNYVLVLFQSMISCTSLVFPRRYDP